MGVTADSSALKNRKKTCDKSTKNINSELKRRKTLVENRVNVIRVVDEDEEFQGINRARDDATYQELLSDDWIDSDELVDHPIVIDSDPALVAELLQANAASKNRLLNDKSFVTSKPVSNSFKGDLDKSCAEATKVQNCESCSEKSSGEGSIEVAKAEQIESASEQVIYRDVDGFRITKDRWLELQALKKGGYKAGPKNKPKKIERESVAWGRGVQQEKQQRQKVEEDLRIAAEPLTRHEMHPSLDSDLKAELRWGDPVSILSDIDGKVSQAKALNQSEVSKPKCKFSAPINRFNIQAGYRWDGVIRGNGYEGRFLQEKNVKTHQKHLAYKWSVEEM